MRLGNSKKIFCGFVIPLLVTAMMMWFLWYFPYAYVINTTWRYLVISFIAAILIMITLSRKITFSELMCVPHTIRDACVLIPVTLFLFFYCGFDHAIKIGWPRNLIGAESYSGLVGAPIGEEILFRGYLFTTLTSFSVFRHRILPFQYMPSFAVLFSSLLFALWHIPLHTQESIFPALFPHFIFGFVLCWVFERIKSLPYVITVHMFTNSFWTR